MSSIVCECDVGKAKFRMILDTRAASVSVSDIIEEDDIVYVTGTASGG